MKYLFDAKTINNKRNKLVCSAGFSTLLILVIYALPIITITGCITGCSDSQGSEHEYIVDTTTRGTPRPEAVEAINVSSRIGFAISMNAIGKLKTTNLVPHTIISGKDVITNFKYVVSKDLRVDRIQEPTGVRIVQVDMSLDGPIPLKQLLSSTIGDFNPAPILHDNIGYYYHPIGYLLDTPTGKRRIDVNIDPGNQIKDLSQLPSLSRSKPQRLTVIFRVNQGVTLTALSYAGQDKILFTVEIPDSPSR